MQIHAGPVFTASPLALGLFSLLFHSVHWALRGGV